MKHFLATMIAAVTAFGAEPAEELATFQIAEGFEVSLFASETNGVVKPIQMRFDSRGRLWVIGSSVYPQLEPGQKPNDKVIILEDTDRDGRADKTTVFADGLMIPTGLELTRDGAYLGHGSELLLLRDTNGDDKADERTVVLRGFGTGDNHQNINSFNWGPSGELWMCQGLHIHSNVETPYGIVRLNQAGIWRFFPGRLKLEGYYGSQHEPQNPWGHVFNEWNEHIVLAGNNSSPIFPDPGLVPRRRDDAPPLLWANGNGRKVSGGDFVANTHFPPEWQGRLILGGYINNAVWSINVVDEGAGFRFEDGPPLIRSTAREFRPVDVRFGPEGALYLCDWYNPIIGHYQASFRDPARDKTHGRIWRVTAKNRPLDPIPNIHKAPTADLLKHLGSENRWARYQAKRELMDRDPGDAATLSDKALMDYAGILFAQDKPDARTLVRLSASPRAEVRAYAAHLLGISAHKISNPLGILRKLAVDSHPRVRLQAIIAAAQIDKPESANVVLLAAEHPFDRFLAYAFNQAIHSLKPHWLPLLQAGRLGPEGLAALVRADGTADTLEPLRKFGDQPAFQRILAETGDANDLASLLKREPSEEVLATMNSRSIRASGDLENLLKPLLDSRTNAVLLAGKWKVGPLLPRLRDNARNASAPAILGLGLAGDVETLRGLLSANNVRSRALAIRALHPHDPTAAARAAAELFAAPQGAEFANDIVTAFLQRPESAKALAAALNGKEFSDEVSAQARSALAASGRRNDELAKVFVKESAARPADWAAFAKEVNEAGRPRYGESIYNRPELGCVACHKINNAGGNIGPNLSALGTAQPIEFIARAILEPQKEVKEGFNSISIATKAGDEFQGYIQRETPEEIFLRDPLLNQEIRIRRSDIATLRPNGSLMPNGLADSLNAEEFRHLVAYLASLGKP